MNKLLVAIFKNETAAHAGLRALQKLHSEGEITVYASVVVAKDASGKVSVEQSKDEGPIGTGMGLAVGSLIGLLGGPAGLAVGAATGTAIGAVRDFWVAGVGLDFIEETDKLLLPGTVAVLAEIEEEWVLPVDEALEAAGGQVLRRTRTEVVEAHFDHDIASMKAEIKELESEAAHATGAAAEQLQTRIAAAKDSLATTVRRSQQRVDSVKREADAKVEALKVQMKQAKGDMKARIEERVTKVKSAQHTRGAKLSQAWNLTKEALAA